MRLRRRWASLVACAAAVGLAGCGTSAPVTKPPVNVTITAPTNGATVGVRQVTVTGTVTPANALVTVAGKPATVRGGAFSRTVWLSANSQSVPVTAQASGYTPAQTNTTVSYSPNLAAQLVASTRALASPSSGSSGAFGLSSSSTALASAVALPSASPARHRQHGAAVASKPAKAPSRPSAPTTGKPTPAPITSTPVTTPHPAPAPAPPPVTAPAPAPVLPSPAEIAARVKQHWEGSCLKGQTGSKVVPYCTCIYTHLVSTGAFKSPSTVNALVRRVNSFLRTGDTSRLTKRIMRALITCAARYPGAQSVSGRTTVTPLSGGSHGPVAPKPPPRLPVGPAPGTTAPTSTAPTNSSSTTTTSSSSSGTGLSQ